MKITCPKCNQAIRVDGIDVAKGSAVCNSCSEMFTIGSAVNNDPVRLAQPQNTKVLLTRSSNRIGVALPRAGIRGIGGVLLLISLFWNGICGTAFVISLLEAYQSKNSSFQAVTLGVNILAMVFVVPALLLGLFIFGAAIYSIFNEVTLEMDNKNLMIKHHVFFWRGKQTFPLSEITDIRLTEAYRLNNTPGYGIGIHVSSKKRPLTFGSQLSEEEKNWLLGELYGFWRERSST